MKLPRIHTIGGTDKKMSDEMIEKGMFMLDEGNSERFVARELGVSRHTVRIHCKRGYKELFRNKYKTYTYIKTQPNQIEKRRELARKRAKLTAKLHPNEMKKYRKIKRQKIGKEYFRIKSIEFRKKNPDYYKNYYQKNIDKIS